MERRAMGRKLPPSNPRTRQARILISAPDFDCLRSQIASRRWRVLARRNRQRILIAPMMGRGESDNDSYY